MLAFWILAIWIAFQVGAVIYAIDQPRKPITPGLAVWCVILLLVQLLLTWSLV